MGRKDRPQPPPPAALKRLDPWRVRLTRYRLDMVNEGLVFASPPLFQPLLRDQTLLQVANVATLPGLVGPSIVMPDAHQGYGFPIGGVAATDAQDVGVISPGGVGFDINCGVRLLHSPLTFRRVRARASDLARAIFHRVPTGFSKSTRFHVRQQDMDDLLLHGAAWVVGRGFGLPEDLEFTEDGGAMGDADPNVVSGRARDRGAPQLGTLGSGNHFIEVQRVARVHDTDAAAAFRLHEGQVVVLIHTGSRGLGHQVCTDQLQTFQREMQRAGVQVPDRQLAHMPIQSQVGQEYLGAMAAAANFAWANRQMITHLVREAFFQVFGDEAHLSMVYDVAHNIAKLESHRVSGRERFLCVHRKGATRALPAEHPELPARYRSTGQPVFIPGSMGAASWVLVGTAQAMREAWGSVCHGAGRLLSRTAARKRVRSAEVARDLQQNGIVVMAGSKRGLAEEFPGAYKDVSQVVDTVVGAGLARRVARMEPICVIKG